MTVDLESDYNGMARRMLNHDQTGLTDLSPNLLSDTMRVPNVSALVSPEKPEKDAADAGEASDTNAPATEDGAGVADDGDSPEKKQASSKEQSRNTSS